MSLLKFMFYYVLAVAMIIMMLIAAPTMWEQATTDKGGPHSGATPDCPSWDCSLEEGLEKAELIRQFRK